MGGERRREEGTEREGMGWGSGDGWGEEIWILIHVDNRINVAMEIFQIE